MDLSCFFGTIVSVFKSDGVVEGGTGELKKQEEQKTTEAQKRATAKWQTERVEEIKFRVPKGQKAVIQEYAAQQGESVNAFIYRAVTEAMNHENCETQAQPPNTPDKCKTP